MAQAFCILLITQKIDDNHTKTTVLIYFVIYRTALTFS